MNYNLDRLKISSYLNFVRLSKSCCKFWVFPCCDTKI